LPALENDRCKGYRIAIPANLHPINRIILGISLQNNQSIFREGLPVIIRNSIPVFIRWRPTLGIRGSRRGGDDLKDIPSFCIDPFIQRAKSIERPVGEGRCGLHFPWKLHRYGLRHLRNFRKLTKNKPGGHSPAGFTFRITKERDLLVQNLYPPGWLRK